MTSEILIGIGGLVLAVLTYFAGVYRTEKRLSKDERNARIQRVFDQVDLKRFFDYAVSRQINFFHTTVDEVIDKSKSES